MYSMKFSQQHVHKNHPNSKIDYRMHWSEYSQGTYGNNNNFKPQTSTINRTDSQTYINAAKQLARGEFPQNIPVNVLPYLPIISMKFNDEIYFTRNCLHNWWLVLSENVNRIERTTLAAAIVGLEKLNCRTNGYVLRIIQWDVIQRLACVFLSGVDNEKVSNK